MGHLASFLSPCGPVSQPLPVTSAWICPLSLSVPALPLAQEESWSSDDSSCPPRVLTTIIGTVKTYRYNVKHILKLKEKKIHILNSNRKIIIKCTISCPVHFTDNCCRDLERTMRKACICTCDLGEELWINSCRLERENGEANVMGCIVSPHSLYFEILTPRMLCSGLPAGPRVAREPVTVFGDRVFPEVIKFK